MSTFNIFIYNLDRWVRVILFSKKINAEHYVIDTLTMDGELLLTILSSVE